VRPMSKLRDQLPSQRRSDGGAAGKNGSMPIPRGLARSGWLKWTFWGILIFGFLFAWGQVAMVLPRAGLDQDPRSRLTADYRPWPFSRFAPVSPDLVADLPTRTSKTSEPLASAPCFILVGCTGDVAPRPHPIRPTPSPARPPAPSPPPGDPVPEAPYE
jgi:hypothetical protein